MSAPYVDAMDASRGVDQIASTWDDRSCEARGGSIWAAEPGDEDCLRLWFGLLLLPLLRGFFLLGLIRLVGLGRKNARLLFLLLLLFIKNV